MSADKVIQEYKELVVTFLRQLEMERARGDSRRLEEIQSRSDDDLLKRSLWIISIVGGLLCFVILPVILGLLGQIISILFMEVLWLLLKIAMAAVLIALFFAIYITVKKTGDKD